jgi:hypothetical protein
LGADSRLRVDVKDSEVPPRWPPVLPKGSFANPTWELVAIDATSISFVVNRILKVSDDGPHDPHDPHVLCNSCGLYGLYDLDNGILQACPPVTSHCRFSTCPPFPRLSIRPRGIADPSRVQADSTGIIDKQSPETCDKTTQDLAVLHEELSSLPDLPEVEWTRLRALEFQDLLRQRGVLRDRLVKMGCQLCPDFEDHVSGAKRFPVFA